MTQLINPHLRSRYGRPYTLIFDLDGTLVDSAVVCRAIINSMLGTRNCSRRITTADMYRFISVGGVKMIAALLGDVGGDPQQDILEFRRLYAELPTPDDSLYPGVKQVLQQLASRGVKMGVCSNKPQYLCDKVLRELALSDLFAAVVGADAVSHGKPNPIHLDETLKQMGETRQDCILVGDSEFDQELAQACDVPFIYAQYGYGPIKEHGEEVCSIKRFDEILGILSQLDDPSRMPGRSLN